VQQAFCGLRVNAGKQVLAAMLEADGVAICGAWNAPDAKRKAVCGGTTRSSILLGWVFRPIVAGHFGIVTAGFGDHDRRHAAA
jgi:hypothetical protein